MILAHRHHEGLLAHDVEPGRRRRDDQRGVQRGRRRDVDKVERRRLAEQLAGIAVQPRGGKQLPRPGPARRVRFGDRHDLHVIARQPRGQVTPLGDVAESDDGAA